MIATLALAAALQCPLSVLGSIWYADADPTSHRPAGMFAEVRNETPRAYVVTGVVLASIDPNSPSFAKDQGEQDPSVGQVHNTYPVTVVVHPSNRVTLVPIPYGGSPGNVTSELSVQCHAE